MWTCPCLDAGHLRLSITEIWGWAWTTWTRSWTSSLGQESQDGPTSYFGEKIGDDDVNDIEASEFYDGEKKSETPACMSLMMAKKRPRIDRFYG